MIYNLTKNTNFILKINKEKNNETSCCGGSCSTENGGCFDSGKKEMTVEKSIIQYSSREKFRDYAYATIFAISAILISKIALRFFYSK